MSQNHILNNATSTIVHIVIVMLGYSNDTIYGIRYNTAIFKAICNNHRVNRFIGIVAILKKYLIISYAIRNENPRIRKTKILFVASGGVTRIG